MLVVAIPVATVVKPVLLLRVRVCALAEPPEIHGIIHFRKVIGKKHSPLTISCGMTLELWKRDTRM